MTPDQRVQAVAKFGFTERQARFLTTVMLHGGVCVRRQYARFAGTAYGRKVNVFFEKLERGGHVVSCDCIHNRAKLYHLRDRALYRAIDEANSRYRRPVAARAVFERLMRLDAVLEYPELNWLPTESETLRFLADAAPSSRVVLRRDATACAGRRRGIRVLPDGVLVGVEPTGHVVFFRS